MNRVRHPEYLDLERQKGISLCPGVSETPEGLYLAAAEGTLCWISVSF